MKTVCTIKNKDGKIKTINKLNNTPKQIGRRVKVDTCTFLSLGLIIQRDHLSGLVVECSPRVKKTKTEKSIPASFTFAT